MRRSAAWSGRRIRGSHDAGQSAGGRHGRQDGEGLRRLAREGERLPRDLDPLSGAKPRPRRAGDRGRAPRFDSRALARSSTARRPSAPSVAFRFRGSCSQLHRSGLRATGTPSRRGRRFFARRQRLAWMDPRSWSQMSTRLAASRSPKRKTRKDSNECRRHSMSCAFRTICRPWERLPAFSRKVWPIAKAPGSIRRRSSKRVSPRTCCRFASRSSRSSTIPWARSTVSSQVSSRRRRTGRSTIRDSSSWSSTRTMP